MKKNLYATALTVCSLVSAASAQEARLAPVVDAPVAVRRCGSMEVLERQLAADPSLAQRLGAVESHTRAYEAKPAAQRTAAVVTIPVVVHVVYRTAAENVPTSQINEQIAVLNRDFAKLNSDANKVPSAFASLAANTNIQFVLAKRTPTGAATTGIIRKQTTVTSWSDNDAVKRSSSGGDNAWPASQYLNLWLCNLGGGLLGYAQFPGGPASTDGVVVLYSSVPGGTSTNYNKGRTATHEVGHWLNLRHIWGDANCGNDLVADTPTQQTDNGGCPSFPHRTCGNTTSGDMFMNYMDYTYDACMYMFTNGQSTRMNALFASGGSRASLRSSLGGTAPRAATVAGVAADAEAIALYPNPASHSLNVAVPADKASAYSVKVYDLRGREMKQAAYDGRGRVAVSALPQGLYQVVISDGEHTTRQGFQKD